MLQRQGIRVESVGKLHYRAEEDPAGLDAEHLSMHVVGGCGVVWASIRDPCISQPGGRRMLGQTIGAGESSYTRYDAAVTQRSMAWLQQVGRQPEQPFVLYVGRVAPHFPLLAPRAFFDLYPPHRLPQPKLHPDTGYVRHPWVQACADFSQNEASFHSADERLAAFSADCGLCSGTDHEMCRVLAALREAGLEDSTTVVYTSDHGDNLGARGLWGKSTLYQESVSVPMLLA